MTALYWWIFGVTMFTMTAPFFLWGHFLVVMSLKRVWQGKEITGLTLAMGIVWLWIGYILDCWVNLTLLSVVLLEVPQELTVTARLKRHYPLVGTWGRTVAEWFIPLLEPYDPGHITGAKPL